MQSFMKKQGKKNQKVFISVYLKTGALGDEKRKMEVLWLYEYNENLIYLSDSVC